MLVPVTGYDEGIDYSGFQQMTSALTEDRDIVPSSSLYTGTMNQPCRMLVTTRMELRLLFTETNPCIVWHLSFAYV